MDRQTRGRHGEHLAKCYLLKHKLSLVEENFRCRWGEIDLIMRDGNTLVFIEVRFRRSGSRVDARASVDTHKQRKLCRAAAIYMAGQSGPQPDARFDVVAVSDNNGTARVEDWIRNAFECTAL
ncbi:MAG: YraN family protein [Pseudomonadota bacterium]